MIKLQNMEAPKPPSLLESYSSRGDDFSALDKKIVSGMFNVASSPYGSIDLANRTRLQRLVRQYMKFL